MAFLLLDAAVATLLLDVAAAATSFQSKDLRASNSAWLARDTGNIMIRQASLANLKPKCLHGQESVELDDICFEICIALKS